MTNQETPAEAPDLELWDAQFELFKTMTPPFRPHGSEAAIMQDVVAEQSKRAGGSGLQTLILGLTPEYVGLEWPAGSRVVVADRSSHVAEQWWPGDVPGSRELVEADWLDMPFDAGSFDLILGDGVFNFMPYPGGFRNLAGALSPLLRPGGRLAVRIFNQANPPEQPASLIEEYHRSDSIDYYGFRFRLATSAQERPERGISANKDTVDACLLELGVDLEEFYEKSGHTPPRVGPLSSQTKDSYRVSYPTDDQFRVILEGQFEQISIRTGDHALARRTPIFVASARSDA